MQTKPLIAVLFLSLLINGFFAYHWFRPEKTAAPLDATEFPYLSKRIFVENPNDIIINIIPLRHALKEYVAAQDNTLGVYFEYLPSGTSIGASDETAVQLSSLSKVPLAMSIFKKSERGKLALDDAVEIKPEHLDQRFGSLWEMGAGTKLPILDLVKSSLIESDNTAYHALFDLLTPSEVNEVYDGLNIEISQVGGERQTLVTPKSYASIFRSLYLSSFLSNQNSSAVLDILTETAFANGIPAGVAEGVPVAHKVGVFDTTETDQSLFIDCGIVYVPSRPYVLCAFVKNTDMGPAQEKVAHISKMVYSYIASIKGGE